MRIPKVAWTLGRCVVFTDQDRSISGQSSARVLGNRILSLQVRKKVFTSLCYDTPESRCVLHLEDKRTERLRPFQSTSLKFAARNAIF